MFDVLSKRLAAFVTTIGLSRAHTCVHTGAHTHTRAPTSGRRTQVRESGVHGKGVYAIRPLRAGDKVLEYKGEIITWNEALRRHPHDPSQPNHTFYFHLDDGHVIDGKHPGNSAKCINHSCEPNLEAA